MRFLLTPFTPLQVTDTFCAHRAAGATFNMIWMRRNPASFEMFMFAISAGMLAGEGLGGVFQALLAIIGVDGGSTSEFHYPLWVVSIYLTMNLLQSTGRLLGALGWSSAGR